MYLFKIVAYNFIKMCTCRVSVHNTWFYTVRVLICECIYSFECFLSIFLICWITSIFNEFHTFTRQTPEADHSSVGLLYWIMSSEEECGWSSFHAVDHADLPQFVAWFGCLVSGLKIYLTALFLASQIHFYLFKSEFKLKYKTFTAEIKEELFY